MDDSKIVDLYFSRDEEAIAETKRKYGTKLRAAANRILNDAQSAEECENDTYMRAWNLIPPNEPRTYLFAFLGKITRHLAIDICRKRDSEKRSAVFRELTEELSECIPSSGMSVEETAENSELAEAINSFLDCHSSEQQNVFVRRYWFFDTVPEISRRYGFTQSKVKMILSRMRAELRDYLERKGFTV
ncbi:MAG: RNA polymerase sigma factor [Clostridia bacterium]|nr:RNA polymerase sigma factor [Clostridia bacterium]